MCFFIKLGRHVSHGERMDPIDFEGQRSKVKVTMDIYGNKLVNMIETKPLCISSSNLADMLTMVNPIDLEVTVQRWRSRWVSLTNVGCAGMLRFALLYLFTWPLFSRGHHLRYIHETLFSRFAISCSFILSIEIIVENFIFASPHTRKFTQKLSPRE